MSGGNGPAPNDTPPTQPETAELPCQSSEWVPLSRQPTIASELDTEDRLPTLHPSVSNDSSSGGGRRWGGLENLFRRRSQPDTSTAHVSRKCCISASGRTLLVWQDSSPDFITRVDLGTLRWPSDIRRPEEHVPERLPLRPKPDIEAKLEAVAGGDRSIAAVTRNGSVSHRDALTCENPT
jgi:hypothetical protein